MCRPNEIRNALPFDKSSSTFELKDELKQQRGQTLVQCHSSDCAIFRKSQEESVRQSRKRRKEVVTYQESDQEDPEDHASKQYVKHDYHDHSKDSDSIYLEIPILTKGGVSIPFPMKLHNMLNHIDLHENELSSIISWQPHGRCFCVHKIKEFTEKVLPRFFQQKKYPSFQRQLNLYGFNRITAGPDKGSYYHELFLRSKKLLCRGIQRKKVKGTGCRMASNPKHEPNFYIMDSMPSFASDNGETVAEVITPPTKTSMIKLEGGTQDSIPEMPPLQLPNSAVEKVTSSRNLELNDDQAFGAPNDLRFVFGGMPFHSLNIEDEKTAANRTMGHRNSLMLPVPLSEDGSTGPIVEGDEEFERQLNQIADLGSHGLSDWEMSEILEKIAHDELAYDEL